ncbi:hypothetical protein ACFL6S_19875 [Candidatus Poribacteria bacterium]
MRYLVVCFALVAFSASLAGAEVFWFEVENFDEELSNLTYAEKGLNVVWHIKDDKFAFGGKYMSATGGDRDIQEAAAGLVYLLPEVEKNTGWKIWINSIMPTTGSDSFFWQLSEDGGEKWGAATAAHGGAVWFDWEWHSWDIGQIPKGDENALRIAERESNAALDLICLRNDDMVPTAEEYEAFLAEEAAKPKPGEAVDARGKRTDVWGRIKSSVSAER